MSASTTATPTKPADHHPTGYRDYVAAEGSHVEKTYSDMYRGQTTEHVAQMRKHYLTQFHKDVEVWDALELLSQVVDESDPDTDLPQIVHALQTAQSIEGRMKDDPEMADKDWLPLVGLIHDLGKIMMLPEYGALPQWSTVGDIFPVGVPLHPACVYQHKKFHEENTGINGTAPPPEQGCGFGKLTFSWSHDVYLAEVLERSGTLLPPEAIYMVRYHSFYPWHTPPKTWDIASQGRPYDDYASDFDREMLPYLLVLQKADLYSKTRVMPERATYEALVKKYIPNPLRF
jgi:inositol oxygenase